MNLLLNAMIYFLLSPMGGKTVIYKFLSYFKLHLAVILIGVRSLKYKQMANGKICPRIKYLVSIF